METKHTPGPWERIGTMVRGPYSIRDGSRPGGLIADCGGYYGPEQHANAQLIAAAPDLLDAAHEARIALCDLILTDDRRVFAKALRKLDEAIAIATGEVMSMQANAGINRSREAASG